MVHTTIITSTTITMVIRRLEHYLSPESFGEGGSLLWRFKGVGVSLYWGGNISLLAHLLILIPKNTSPREYIVYISMVLLYFSLLLTIYQE